MKFGSHIPSDAIIHHTGGAVNDCYYCIIPLFMKLFALHMSDSKAAVVLLVGLLITG